MMRKTNYIIFAGITVTIILIIFYSFSDTTLDENYVREVRKYREQKDNSFKEEEDSPITPDIKPSFTGLSYFEPDISCRITAKVTRLETDSMIATPTNTEEARNFIRYGFADFMLENQPQRLLLLKPAGKAAAQQLFLAFTDETTGQETYEAGRYIDVEEPVGNQITIDFNMAYNPYCAYNPGYSCPIPPPENHLKVHIRAGEKNYLKSKK